MCKVHLTKMNLNPGVSASCRSGRALPANWCTFGREARAHGWTVHRAGPGRTPVSDDAEWSFGYV